MGIDRSPRHCALDRPVPDPMQRSPVNHREKREERPKSGFWLRDELWGGSCFSGLRLRLLS